MDWKDVKAELLKDPKLAKAYKRLDLGYILRKAVINLRIWLYCRKSRSATGMAETTLTITTKANWQ